MRIAAPDVVGIERLEDLIAWQLADQFKRAVYEMIRASPGARADAHFREQLSAAAASAAMNIAEGFYRFSARDVARFMSVAVASLGEASQWLQDGVDRGHFTPQASEEALNLANRCRRTTLRFRSALLASSTRNNRGRRVGPMTPPPKRST